MSDQEKRFTIAECHQVFAPNLFNMTWDLLDKADRTTEDDANLLRYAYASLYHWSKIGQPVNLQRGEWMVSHVWAVLGQGEAALFHAKICLELTQKHDFKDFDLAYAYEAMYRASGLCAKIDDKEKYYQLAQQAAEKISQAGDRKQFLSDLQA